MNLRTDPGLLSVSLAPQSGRTVEERLPLHDARVLTQGGVQARILLDGQVYALRITRAGKLILTK